MLAVEEGKTGVIPFGSPANPPFSATSVSYSEAVSTPEHDESCRKSGLALIDAYPVRRTGTLRLLRAHIRVGARGFDCIAELLEKVCPSNEPPQAIILCCGGQSPMEPPAFEQIRRLSLRYASTPVVILSDRAELQALIDAFRAGARGYIPTSLDPHLVIEAIRMVLAGGTFLPADPLLRHRRTAPPLEPTASPPEPPSAKMPVVDGGATPEAGLIAALMENRDAWPAGQLAVLSHLVKGRANKEIARALAMDESAVKSHVRNIMRRLEVTNRTQVALVARRLGIFEALDDPIEQAASGGAVAPPAALSA